VIKKIYSKLGIMLVLVVVFIGLSFASPYFLQATNLINIMLQISTTTVVAVGMTFVILTGGIDLSVGSIVAISGMSMAVIHKALYEVTDKLVPQFFIGIVVPMLAGVVIGGIVGSINGIIIAKGRVPAFIMTLGMMSMARGATYLLTDGQTVSIFPDSFRYLGNGRVFDFIPFPVIISIILVVIAMFILKYTKFGRYIYALGGNKEALRLSGINIVNTEVKAYIISGITCGIAAIILLGRLNLCTPVVGDGYELDAIGAVIIGGTSIFGGEGKVEKTLLGAMLMGMIRNGLNLLNISPNVQLIAIGFIVVAAVFYDKARDGAGLHQ